MNYKFEGEEVRKLIRLGRWRGHASSSAWMLFGLAYGHYHHAPADVFTVSAIALGVALLVFVYLDVRCDAIVKAGEQ